MSNSATIFQVHEERGNCNAKILAHAARCGVPNGYVLMSQGASWYERTRDFLQRIPTPVQHDLLNDIVDGTPFAIVPKGERPETPILQHCVSTAGELMGGIELLLVALHDNKIDDREFSELDPAWAAIERKVAQVRLEMNARRSKVRIAR